MNDVVLLKSYCQYLSILYVEDEKDINESMCKYLNKFFNNVETAFNGKEGLEKYKSGKFDIVLTDIRMPKLNGIEMIREIKAINDGQEIIIISAHTEIDYFLSAIHMGVSDYILKPTIYEQVNSVLYKVAGNVNIRKEYKNLHENLKSLVKEQTKSITDNYEKTIKAMVDLVESRDTYTGGHSERVANYSKAIAQEMNLSDEDCELVFRAGMLHDIGKVTTPDSILLKPGELLSREYSLIQKHVSVSYELLSKIPMYEKLSEIVITHHECYDGSGYPNALKGDEIPLLGKIMIIADSFDAMTTDRIYKGHRSIKSAILEIQECSGTQFDPAVVPFACKVLSTSSVNNEITQLPKDSIENKRFSYFFHDSLTDNYNKEYLEIFLKNLPENNSYSARAYYLCNFSQYNKKFDWDKGNTLLKTFAEYLMQSNPNAISFRIDGDDFILISKEPFSEDCINPSFLKSTDVSVKCQNLSVDGDLISKFRNIN